jgi:molybdopterin synthase catalytic subunit
MRRHIQLTEEPIDSATLSQWVHDAETGAVVTFEGRVRETENGNRIIALDYEVYQEMALKQMGRVADEIEKAYSDVRALALEHRTGPVEVGASAVVVAVGAVHRQRAFDACRYGIDRLKEIVPIWKRIAPQSGHEQTGQEQI